MYFLQLSAIIICLVCFHEMGHVMVAKVFRLKIEKIGFTFFPFPHPYVSVLNVPENYQKYWFLFGGILVTVVIFSIFWISDLLYVKAFYYAICFELVFDTNPFHSDINLAFNTRDDNDAYFKIHYDKYLSKYGERAKTAYGRKIIDQKVSQITNKFVGSYKYSFKWYVHLFLWGALLILLFSPTGIKQYFITD